MKKNEILLEQVKNLPNVSGCYLYQDKNKQLIYVGKAKSLKKRVTSYFTKVSNFKTMQLVNDIVSLDFITTNNEKEALILEQTLIKKYHPKYNILLADDKRYPYIQVTKEKDPQYHYLRRANKDQGNYYGPFPDGTGAREILKLLERIIPLRKCAGNLGKPCLYYHLGQCSGACFKAVPWSYYQNQINKINQFFKGNVAVIKQQLQNSMSISSDNQQYEAANRIKILLEKIDLFLSQQVVEFQDFGDRDFINYLTEDNLISIVTLFYRNGKLQAKDEYVGKNNFLDIEDFVRNYCTQLYNKNTLPKEIYLPNEVEISDLKLLFPTVKFFHPVKGKKENILNIAKTNAVYAWKNYLDKAKTSEVNMMKVLTQWLKLPVINHLEVFDVSNLYKNASVGAMIVYKDGKPSFNDYRRFLLNPKLNDDYHRFEEMIYRRYYNLLVNKLPLPDLIIVDGGKPQIQATLNQLQLLNLKIPVIGLAKNKKHQTDRVINSKFQVVHIPKNDICFLFLANLQDQIHNYAIKYHKLKRSQSMINSFLATIPGIGPKLQKEILAKFPTFSDLQGATYDELKVVIKSTVVLKKLWLELHSFEL
ncbi:MAG: excinuclease ABC subunit UvrC [Spiroplasma sp.]|nr:excinuclease ABC subunit UvrC [Spiroplasma sp.]